jgi:hypothetical protein
MKRKSYLVLLLLVLAGIAGYVLSKASLVGRVGISLFYRQYKFLKVWWQGGLLIFVIWMILFFLQGWVQRKLSPKASQLIQVAAVVFALSGLYFTYQDFRHTTSHRWLGERFHLGGYLFWLGWIIISVFYLNENRKSILSAAEFSGKDTLAAPGKNST